MSNQVVWAEGTPSSLGLAYGQVASQAIQANLRNFWEAVRYLGYDHNQARELALGAEDTISLARLEEIEGMARGAGVSYDELLAYNLLHPVVFPDECSVVVAHGTAGKDGHTIFLKNSDKVGGPELTGTGFYQGKEINVLVYKRPAGLPAYMGVAAAGTTGLKFGCSDQGIAVGTNICRTNQLKAKAVSLTTVRAADRADLARVALEEANAREAALRISSIVAEAPMGTPGNMEFVDSTSAWFLEGSYDRQALTSGQNGVFVRTNRFELFHELNDAEDISSHCRYVRANQVVRPLAGNVTVDTLVNLSQDHENGPGLNSLCRHDDDSHEETSLSSGVVDIDPSDPKKTTFHVALGKPCLAWKSPSGHVTLSYGQDPASVDDAYYNGEAWVKHYTEEL